MQNPLDRLLSKDYATGLRARITDRATPSAELGGVTAAPAEKPQTTHYSVVDKARNAVAVTYTINGGFGAGVIAGDTGFLLNDEMDDFTVKPGAPNMFGLVQGEANAIAPGKRPLSSMAPTIVLKDGQVRMVLGSPGGSRIITDRGRNDPQHDRPRHDAAGGGGRAAAAHAVDARRAVRGAARAFA